MRALSISGESTNQDNISIKVSVDSHSRTIQEYMYLFFFEQCLRLKLLGLLELFDCLAGSLIVMQSWPLGLLLLFKTGGSFNPLEIP